MCTDLEQKLEEISENEKSDLTKDAKKLFRATMKAFQKFSNQFKEHIDSDNKWKEEINAKIQEVIVKFDAMKADAETGRAATIVLKALFGTPKRAVMTLIYVVVILGLANIKDIKDLLTILIS